MNQRLQKILSDRGVPSRRKAEEMISAGRVTVNGRVALLGSSADADLDDIRVDGQPLPAAAGYIYLMLNKPRGYVTTLSDEKGRQTAAQLVADCGQRVYPIGRLDMDSEGLLLFTNDGAFANRLMHPKHEVEKAYLVQVSGYTRSNFSSWHCPSPWTATGLSRLFCVCWRSREISAILKSSSMRDATGRSAGCARQPGCRCSVCGASGRERSPWVICPWESGGI